MTGALHRVGQFWRHASARVDARERATVQQILGPTLAPIFFELPLNDQRHGLDVLQTVDQQEPAPSLLLRQAALLHDAGKQGAAFSVIDRSLTVFLAAVSPRLLNGLLAGRPAFARRFQIYANHAAIGAERLRAAGAHDLAAIVAEHHAPHPGLEATEQLQRADRRN
ncbi:MAG TPA: HD domain-containing protein [Candidatus Dormibacteraeota bacterium]